MKGMYCEDNVHLRVERIATRAVPDHNMTRFTFRALEAGAPHYITKGVIQKGEEFEVVISNEFVHGDLVGSPYCWDFTPDPTEMEE